MSDTPAIIPTLDYHWTPAGQRLFLEELAANCNISGAARAAGMSNQAAYAFRHRSAGVLFKMAWDAAALMARARLSDELFERAMTGQTEIYERDADIGRVTRTRAHNGLSMAVLKRLDQMACASSAIPADTAVAQIVAGDFEAFLDLISAENDLDDKILCASMFLLERAGAVPVTDLWPAQFALHYQLTIKTADLEAARVAEEEAAQKAEIAANAAAAKTKQPRLPSERFWTGFMSTQLRTDFPPPPGFAGSQDGKYGNPGYSRTCTYEETKIFDTLAEVKAAPRLAADAAIRNDYFAGLIAEIHRLEATNETEDGAGSESEG